MPLPRFLVLGHFIGLWGALARVTAPAELHGMELESSRQSANVDYLIGEKINDNRAASLMSNYRGKQSSLNANVYIHARSFLTARAWHIHACRRWKRKSSRSSRKVR